MKYTYFLLIFLSPPVLYAQNDTAKHYNPYDTLLTALSYTFISSEEKLFLFDSLIYFDDEDSLKSFFRKAGLRSTFNTASVDFENYSLILIAYSGVDCHSGFIMGLLDDSRNRQYVFDVAVMYGGCRAGGRNYKRWALVPKLPKDYSIIFYKHIVYERDWESDK